MASEPEPSPTQPRAERWSHACLLPASGQESERRGAIRAQGTGERREYVTDEAAELDLTVDYSLCSFLCVRAAVTGVLPERGPFCSLFVL